MKLKPEKTKTNSDTAKALARIDWNRSGELWKNLVTEKVLPDGSVKLFLHGAGSSTKRSMADILRHELGLTALFKEKEAA